MVQFGTLAEHKRSIEALELTINTAKTLGMTLPDRLIYFEGMIDAELAAKAKNLCNEHPSVVVGPYLNYSVGMANCPSINNAHMKDEIVQDGYEEAMFQIADQILAFMKDGSPTHTRS